MTATARPDRKTLDAARLIERAATKVTEAKAHALHERATHDGYSHGGTTDDGSRPTSSSSTTETAALFRIRPHLIPCTAP